LTLGLGSLLVGRLSDLFGRRWFFILGNLLSLVGCIVSATAKTIPVLIGATVLIGFSAAVQQSFGFVLGEIVPMKWRFYATAYIYTCCLPWSGFGPAIAYSLIQVGKHTWRSCYYLFIGIDALTIALYYFL
jgi:MFS family permease